MTIRAAARKAFTLIELLVVIAIIALLLSILMPSLKQAKELAARTLCSSQVRSLTLAVNMYASENNETFPLTGGIPAGGGRWSAPENDLNNWIRLLVPYYQDSSERPSNYYRLSQPSQWLCPSDARTPRASDGKYNLPSYTMNIWLTGFYSTTYRQTPYKLSDVPSTNQVPVIGERDGSPFAAQPESITWNGFSPYPHRHIEADVFSFCDGHVDYVPSLDVTNSGNATRTAYKQAGEFFTQDRRFWN